jgi:hypothetical protein
MEKQIKINVDIQQATDEFNKLAASLEKTDDAAKDLESSANKAGRSVTQQGKDVEAQNAKIQQMLKEEMQDLEELRKRRANSFSKKEIEEYNARIRETGQRIKSMGGSFEELKNVTMMSLGEMKKELRTLRNVNFGAMSPEQIQQTKQRMAELTDGIDDFQREIKTSSADAIPAMVNGLQGIVAGAQLVTGTLALFGVENKKLQQSMVALIGVSQSLNQLYLMIEQGTFRTMRATILNTAAKIKATIATTALGKAMLSLPIMWIVAGLALVAGAVAGLVTLFRRKASAMENLAKKYKETFEEGFKLVGQFTLIEKRIKETTKGTVDHARAVGDYNKMAKEQNLRLISVNDSMKEQNKVMEENKRLMMARVALTAVEAELTGLMQERLRLQFAMNSASGQDRLLLESAIRNMDKQIEGYFTLNNQLGSYVSQMNAAIQAEHEKGTAAENLIKGQKNATEETAKATKETEKQTVATRKATGELILMMDTIKMSADEISRYITEIYGTTIPDELEKVQTLTDEFFKMSRQGAIDVINDVNSTAQQRAEAINRVKEIDNDKLEKELKNIRDYGDAVNFYANTAAAAFQFVADASEEGSERQKKAMKAAAIADLVASQSVAIANLIVAWTKEIKDKQFLGLATGAALFATGLGIVSQIGSGIARISKLEDGGRGQFKGKRHSQGGMRFGNVEVEGGENFYVLSRSDSKKYGHVMDSVFDRIKNGQPPTTSYSPNINLNDKYTAGMYNIMKKQGETTDAGSYKEEKKGNKIRRIYKN